MDKPLPLLEYLIEKSSQPGEVVCDPFMAEGAVCLAAKKMGRKYLGIEADKHQFTIARQRLGEEATACATSLKAHTHRLSGTRAVPVQTNTLPHKAQRFSVIGPISVFHIILCVPQQ